MSRRIVVDPVTRIEGHLRIEAMLDDRGMIHDAMSSGTMWRGIEVILEGRDPRDAWAFCERIDRKSTRLNSSHLGISYAVFCLKKKLASFFNDTATTEIYTLSRHDALPISMWRGIEVILEGRDPRDAWAFCERICGVCTTVHALASVRAVENALGIRVPQNADIIRNIMALTQMVQDHVIHFYHLHALDWVDVVSALKADPAATAALAQKVSPTWPTSSP